MRHLERQVIILPISGFQSELAYLFVICTQMTVSQNVRTWDHI